MVRWDITPKATPRYVAKERAMENNGDDSGIDMSIFSQRSQALVGNVINVMR